MNYNQWPIKPRFLRRIYHVDIAPNEDDLNFNGIFTKTSLQGFIAVVTHDYEIDNSSTLIEFLPPELIDPEIEKDLMLYESFPDFIKPHINTCNILRTDSYGFRELNAVCKYYRDSEEWNNCVCYRNDSIVLLNNLKNIDKSNYVETIQNYLAITRELDVFNIKLGLYQQHPYFYYTCDVTGFTENCFPIFFEERIIACLVMGGIIEKDFSEKEIIENVLKHCSKNKIYINIDDLHKKVSDSFSIRNKYIERIEREGYDFSLRKVRVKRIIEHIRILETRIDKRINLHRYRYISENFKEVKSYLNETIDSQLIEDEFPKIQRTLNKSLLMIHKAFPNKGFLIIFGVRDFLTPHILFPIAHFGDKDNIGQYYYDKSKIIDLLHSQKQLTFTNHGKPEIIKGLQRKGKHEIDFNPNKDILRYFQTTSPKVSLLIWKQYDETWQFESNDSGTFKLYTDAMLEFYTNVALNFSLFWGKKTEDRLGDIMRVTGHESRQILPRLKDTLESNFQYQHQIDYNLKNNIYHHKYEDLKIYLDLLNSVVERPSFLLKPIKADCSSFAIYELLHKIRSLYTNEAIHRDKTIIVKEGFSDRDAQLYADNELFTQVLYNLVDNAVKYSYRGSNIILKYKSLDEKNYMINIISYGPQILEGEKIYDLYVRGKNVIELEDGLGIGMYICRKIISEAHSGRISHTSIQVSKFNIPCLDHYGRSNRQDYLIPLVEDRKKLEDEIEKLEFTNIIAKSQKGNYRFEPVKETFILELRRKTFLNTFNITISKP